MVKKEKLKKIIIGTWPISGDYSEVQDKESIKMLKYAYKFGITEFDTAPNYGFGKSESLIGKTFEKFRVKPKINTKIGNNHKKYKNFNIKILKETFENSLKLMMIKKVNTLYLHNPKKIQNQKKIINFLKSLKKNNKINSYGLSISKGFKYNDKFINKFDTIQLDYNILYLKNVLNKQFKKKIVHARSPFASGTIFLNKKDKIFSKNDFRYKWVTKERRKVIKSQLKTIQKTFKVNIYDFSLNFLFSDKFVKKIIFGIKNKPQLESLFKSLKKIDRKSINSEDYKNFYFSNDIFKKKGF